MIWLLRVLVIAGIGLAGLAISAQPRVADDWNLAWTLAHYGSVGNFVAQSYLGWSGRVLPFLLAGLALSSELGTLVFKLLTVPCFLLLSAAAAYLSGSTLRRLVKVDDNAWPLAAAILWLGLPVLSDTIVQTSGACGYLWPAAMGLAFLSLIRHARDCARSGRDGPTGWARQVGWFIAGAATGTCNEQLFAGMVVVLAGWGFMLWRDQRLCRLPTEAWFGVAGFLLGTLILVAAPGNYVRLSAEGWSAGGMASMLLRYAMYLGGAYFALGTGDAGRTLWLGVSLIALTGTFALGAERTKEAGIWVAASLATLAPMLPLVNVASPRTTFFAALFLVIATLTAFPRKTDVDAPTQSTWLVAYALAMLVVIDGLAGWAANRSLASEVANREAIMRVAASAGRTEVLVPYLATIPSRLTYLLNPRHDAEFLPKLARHFGLENARHDESPGAPRPYTLNALKALKSGF